MKIEERKIESNAKYTRKHMCMSIEGCLINHKKKKINFMQDDDGRFISDAEARKYLSDCLSKGWRVIPMGECDNFDYQTGCKGHTITKEEFEKN